MRIAGRQESEEPVAYRTLSQPGADANGGQRRGVKITTSADTGINSRLPSPLLKKEAQGVIENIRAGSAGTNGGTYTINTHVCFHAKFGGQAYALAWRAPPGDQYCYIEAVMKKTGTANNYALF
jgi:hypothetical protein